MYTKLTIGVLKNLLHPSNCDTDAGSIPTYKYNPFPLHIFFGDSLFGIAFLQNECYFHH